MCVNAQDLERFQWDALKVRIHTRELSSSIVFEEVF